MIIGYSVFGLERDRAYQAKIPHKSYSKIALETAKLDELFLSSDITIPFSTEPSGDWDYRTTLKAEFKENLEGGSIQANNFEIEVIRFQRRGINGSEWEDIGEVAYEPEEKLVYEFLDKNIQSDFEYQYALLPLTHTVTGRRVLSSPVTAGFEAVFLSDKDNNYSLIYNLETDPMVHNISSVPVETLNAKYPIVMDGNLDYRSGGITALFISTDTVESKSNKVTIHSEKLGRERLLAFLKDRRPKVLRQPNGETLLIRVVDKPEEAPYEGVEGLSTVNFSFVEVGGIDSDTLLSAGMLPGMDGGC